MKTAVLIHGCHLQADFEGDDWEKIVWGTHDGVPSLYGRGTMGLREAFAVRAEFAIFSTGASERDGIKEGEYTYRYALSHVRELARVLGIPEAVFHDFLHRRVELDLESQNTTQECAHNLALCAERGIDTVILVSSAWHIERCHAEALSVAETMRQVGQAVPKRILAVGSHGSAKQVTILEPPHRGDRPRTNWQELGRSFFKIPEDKRCAFEAGFKDLVSKYAN